jgi:ubiquinone/menaquinone biosynthesis C-methylase UbiE
MKPLQEKQYDDIYKNIETPDFKNYIRNDVLPVIFTKPEKVLDLAGGTGVVTEWLLKSVKCDVTLVDFSEVALARAKERGIEKRVYLNVETDVLPFKDNSFDSVFWGDNIEHLLNPMHTLGEIYRVLVPGGRIVLSFPNMSYWYYRYLYMKTGTPQFGYCIKEPWEYEHVRCYNKKIVAKMLDLVKFRLDKVYGVNDRNLKLQYKLSGKFPELFASLLIMIGVKK